MNIIAQPLYNPLDLKAHAKARLIELIMAVHGCGSPDPRNYRRMLWDMDLPALHRALDEPPDFPAVSLTGNNGVIASDPYKGTVPDSSREPLTLKSTLP